MRVKGVMDNHEQINAMFQFLHGYTFLQHGNDGEKSMRLKSFYIAAILNFFFRSERFNEIDGFSNAHFIDRFHNL